MKIHRSFRLIFNGKEYGKTDLPDLNSVSTKNRWIEKILSFLDEWISLSTQINVRTSGSSGNLKLITLEKKDMITSALLTAEYFNLRENDTALLCLPVDFIAGKMMLVRAAVLGLKLQLAEASKDPLFGLDNRSFPFDFAPFIPAQVYNILRNHGSSERFEKIHKVIIGGAPLEGETRKKVETLDNKVYATYGMTETISHVAVHNLNGEKQTDYFEGLDEITFSKDDRNCLIIQAPHLNSGEAIHTNDVVELLDKRRFRWKGRYDNIINSGGIKIQPEKIEHSLRNLITSPFYVTSERDPELGEKVILILKGKENQTDLAKLTKDIENTLSSYEKPKEIRFVQHFEYTETGKLIRKKY